MFNSPIPNLGLESLQPYPNFYRRYGIRRAVQLVGPTLVPLQKLELPRDSILHFIPEDEATLGIPQDDWIVRNNPRLLMVHHNLQLGDNKGQPRSTMLPPTGLIRDYHRKNRKTRPLTNYDAALRDSRTLIVENYGLLPHLYRYPANFYRAYYKWWNIQSALFNRVGEIAKITDRQQYLQCKLPRLLPTLSLLRRAEASLTRSMLASFAEPEALFILELWKWLGEKREESVLTKAGADGLAKLNLIWEESGRWFVLNLGLLDQWRMPTKEERARGAKVTMGAIAPDQLQKRFLRLLMFLFEARTVAETKNGAEVAEPERDVVEEQKLSPRPLSIRVPTADGQTASLRLREGMDVDHLPERAVEETEENIRAIDEVITRDLEALNHLHEEGPTDAEVSSQDEPPTAPEPATPVMDYKPVERTLAESVMVKVDELADQGLLSGAEYRRFQAIASAYTKLPDPYTGEGSLADQLTVDAAELTLDDAVRIPDIDTVVDKSMLKSTLFEFDSRYIRNVLKKDVLRSVVAMQNAGVAVTGYSVEQVEDALTSAEVHTVQLTPVQGKPSTIKFTIPKVAEDGTFRSNGVRYRMRKQRGDMPIRKLSPTRVALTSYYSKVFVTRSEKQIHNYAGWITNQIAAMGMDPENTKITNLMLSNVFNSNNRTPRIYSIMAQRFRSFSSGEYDFFFDYAARHAHFGKDAVNAAEKHGMVVIGRHNKNLLVVDDSDTIYSVKGDELTLLGDTGQFEAFLGLAGKAPLEMVEVKVFNKLVPLGIFLAYHLGLSNLLSLLKVTPRRVATGERTYMNDDEFALRFEDELLIFSRENRLVTQILAGIATFEKVTRNYPVHLFDRKDIYFNILEQAGIGVRYLREMDLMVDLFVDPITKEILQDMGEPIDFIGLLLRANELLLTDWSPDETDMAYMRIKGYERVAGAVYGELVKAIRVQRARGSAARAKIELPPYAVWQTIQQDPAVKLVEESNPIHNLKEKEEITYSGVGGRSDRSMTAPTRVFHKNDMGVISEATKDSAAVAITTFLTADPNLKNLRGVTRPYDPNTDGPTKLLSSSALLAPAADRDDQ